MLPAEDLMEAGGFLKILLINHRSEVMERQRLVLSQNIDACEITACRPGLTLLEVNEKIIPDIAAFGNRKVDRIGTRKVDHLRYNPGGYPLPPRG